MNARGAGPLTVALVNDFEIIVEGLAAMLAPFDHRIRVVELETGGTPDRTVDLALFDTYGGRFQSLTRARSMVEDRSVGHVVLYTWDLSDASLRMARSVGVSGVVPKSCASDELVAALEDVSAGVRVGLDSVTGSDAVIPELTTREREVLARLGRGMSNREIAQDLYLGVETVRTYVRQVLQKLGVENRTQAALWTRHLGAEDVDRRTATG